MERAETMKTILFAALLLLVACPPAPPTGPGTAYPCGVNGVSCGNHMCCDEGDACGGTPGCPEGYCCFVGAEKRAMKLQRRER